MSSSNNEMLGLFIQEAEEHLATLDNDLVFLETDPTDQETINRVFRAVHSIKGTAGFFGLSAIVELAHGMENVMALVRDGLMGVNPTLVNLFLAGTDKLRLMVADPDDSPRIDAAAELSGLSLLLHREPAEVPAPETPMLPPEVARFSLDPELIREGLRRGKNFFIIELNLMSDVESQSQTMLQFFDELHSLGELIDTVTDSGAPTGLEEEVSPDLVCSVLFSTPMEQNLVLGAFGLAESTLSPVDRNILAEWIKTQPTLKPSERAPEPAAPSPSPAKAKGKAKSKSKPKSAAPEASIDPLESQVPIPSPEVEEETAAEPPPPLEKALAPASTAAPSAKALATPETTPVFPVRVKPEETVRLSVSLLDTLMNLAGEMVVGRNKLARCVERGAGQELQGELQAVLQQISTATSNLQRTVMAARLQPVGGLFGKFNRIVRDLAQKLGKQIHLEILGEEVELDRTLLEGLSDPLTHLVRNSADHGIESAEERLALGKAAHGRVRLAAAHLHGRVQIEVRDDGRGLDPAKLKAKAIEKGILTTEAAASLSDTEAHLLIFAPGFSTAAAVTDVSGRGVGMDVVKTNIERLGGTVEIDSEVGRGTAIIVRLPLTLAIIPALIVVCGDRRFALPQLNVEEIVCPDADNPLEVLGGAQVLRLRESLVPVLDLATVLQQPPPENPPETRFVLIVNLDHTRYGLLVDLIDNMEEIVVKPLGRLLQGVPWYSGATLLGQGDIALILDPTALAHGRLPQEGMDGTQSSTRHQVATDARRSERVLVFRDGTDEQFALPLESIGRVEKIPASRIERLGARECLRQTGGPTLSLLRLGHYLPVSPPGFQPEEVFVIVPRISGVTVGIMATEIIDSTDLFPDEIEQSVASAPGLLGTATLLDRLTSVLDLYDLLTLAGLQPRTALPPSQG